MYVVQKVRQKVNVYLSLYLTDLSERTTQYLGIISPAVEAPGRAKYCGKLYLIIQGLTMGRLLVFPLSVEVAGELGPLHLLNGPPATSKNAQCEFGTRLR